MERIFCIFSLLILLSCGQVNSEKSDGSEIPIEEDIVHIDSKSEETRSGEPSNLSDSAYDQRHALNTEFKEVVLFMLTDTLKADFNGDGNTDRAILKKIGETSGLLIQHGETMEEIRIGFGQSFATWTDFNLNWIDFWALVNDSGTYEIVIENNEITGTRKIELENPSIAVRKEEEGGGLITFKDGKYQWIHQAE